MRRQLTTLGANGSQLIINCLLVNGELWAWNILRFSDYVMLGRTISIKDKYPCKVGLRNVSAPNKLLKYAQSKIRVTDGCINSSQYSQQKSVYNNITQELGNVNDIIIQAALWMGRKECGNRDTCLWSNDTVR